MDLIEQIQDAIAARLIAAATYAGAAVEKDREWPLAPDEGVSFDALLVNLGREEVVESTPQRPRRITCDMEVMVRAISRVTSADGESAKRARALALQVKLAILGAGSSPTLGGAAKIVRYGGSTPIDDEKNLDLAGREISFVVRFQTLETSFQVSA